MGEANKILRNSIHAFFHGYHSFVFIAVILVFPFSAALLTSQTLIISSAFALRFISSRIGSLFQAAAFPASSQLFSLLNLMLSQTIFSAIFTLPITLTFLLLAKASIIQIMREYPRREKFPPPFSSLLNLSFPLLLTHLFASFLILSANASVFILLFLAFNASGLIGLSSDGFLLVMTSSGAILYSVVIANTVVICNLAIIVSAMDKCSAYLSVLKACVLIKGRVATALSIALPTNLAMVAVEALFQYRVVRTYHLSTTFNVSIVWEAFTIMYMHSILIVVEIIAGCLFYKGCKSICRENLDVGAGFLIEIEPEDKGEV